MHDERFLGCWSQAAAQFMSVHSAGIFLASFEHVDECECETIKTATAEIVAQALEESVDDAFPGGDKNLIENKDSVAKTV